MKRCRLCGRQFPDNYSFCDQDASRLPVSRRLFAARAAIAGGVVSALVLALTLAPGQLRRYLRSRVALEVTGVSLRQGAPLSPSGDVDLNLRVRNSAPFSPALRSVRLDCGLASRDTIRLEWPSGWSKEVLISADKDTDLSLKVSPRNFDPDSVLSAFESKAEVVCKGPAEFSVWGIVFTQDLQFGEKLW